MKYLTDFRKTVETGVDPPLKSTNPVPIFLHHPSGKNGDHRQMNACFSPPISSHPKLFRITRELYTLVFRPKQLWLGSGGSGGLMFSV